MPIALVSSVSGLPLAADGTVQNGPLTGTQVNSYGLHINLDGTVATNVVKNAQAFLSSFGWLLNPDGSLVVGAKQAGAFVGSNRALLNPDNSVVTSTVKQGGAFICSGGWLVNPDGTMVTAV